MLIEELLSKGFNLKHSPSKPVQHPGIRGGKGYYTNSGKWVYGIRPVPKTPHIDYAYGVEKVAKPIPVSDLAMAINKHLKPYLEKLIEKEEFFNTGVINLRGELGGNDRKTNKVIDEAIKQTEAAIEPYIKPGFTPRILGAGMEAMAIDLGDKVARIQVGGNNIARWTTSTVPERPNFPWMLQAIDKGETKLLGWEVLPRAELVNRALYDTGENVVYNYAVDDKSTSDKDIDNSVAYLYYSRIKKDISDLTKLAEADKYDFGDNHPGNIGYVNGKVIIIDPGAVVHFEEDKALNVDPEAGKASSPTHEEQIQTYVKKIADRGYKTIDKTQKQTPEEQQKIWRAVNAITDAVEKAIPGIGEVLQRQNLTLSVTSISPINGVRGEFNGPQYSGDTSIIHINAEYPRSFMHELGHYIDSAGAILHPSGQWNYNHKLSDIYGTPLYEVVAKLKTFPEYREWIAARNPKHRRYWTSNTEVFARFFDEYMYHKLGKPPSDSYEPYTDQELEEAGKLMEEALKKIKLLKSMINLDRLSKAGWITNHRKPVQSPGSRGSTKWYRTKEGAVEYGDRPDGVARAPIAVDTFDGLGDVLEEVLESYLGSGWKKAIIQEWENSPERQNMVEWVFKESKIYGLKGHWTKKDVADFLERTYINSKATTMPYKAKPLLGTAKPIPHAAVVNPTNGPGYNFSSLELKVLEAIFGGGSSNFVRNLKDSHLRSEPGELGLIHYLTHEVFGQGQVIKNRPESMTSKQAREGLVNLLSTLNTTLVPDPNKPGAPAPGTKPKPANYRIKWKNDVIDANIRDWIKYRMPMQDEAEALDNLPFNFKKDLATYLKEKGITPQQYGVQSLGYDYADRLGELQWEAGTIKGLREQFLPFDFPDFPSNSGIGYAIRQWREKEPDSKVKNAVDFYADLTDKQRSQLKDYVTNYIISAMSAKDIKSYYGSAANLYPETEDVIDDFLTRTTDKQFKRKLVTQHRGLEKEAKARIGVIGPTGKWIKSALPEPEFLTHYSEDSTRRMWASIATNYDLWQSTEDDDRTSLERWYNDQNTMDFVDTMMPYFKKQIKIFGEAYVKEFIKKTTGQGMAIANSINVALYNGEKIDQYGQPYNEQAAALSKEMYDYGYNEVRDMSYKWGQTPESRVKRLRNSLEQLKTLHKAIPGLTELVKSKKLILQLQDLVESGDAAGLYQGSSRSDRVFGILSIDQNEESTLIHEVGHFIDNALAGPNVSVWFASGDSRNELYDLLGDIKKTTSYQKFIQGIKSSGGTHGGMYDIKYYETPTEVFARFFASEVLHKTGRDNKQRRDQEMYSTAELDTLWPKLEKILKDAALVKSLGVAAIKPPETMRPVRPVHLQSHTREPVKNPGSRGSTQWYRNDEGVVEYGVKPQPHVYTHEEEKDTRPKISDVKATIQDDPAFIKFMKEQAADIKRERTNITDPSSLFIHMNFDSKELNSYSDEDITKLAKLMATRAESELNYSGTYKENRGTLTDTERAKLTKQYINYAKKIRDIRIAPPKSSDNSVFTHSVKLTEHSLDTPKEHDDEKIGSSKLSDSIHKEHPKFNTDNDWQKFITKNIVPRMRMLGVTDDDAEEFNLIVSDVLPGVDTKQLETTSRILIGAWWKSADGKEALSVAMQRMTSKVFPGAKAWDTKNPWNGDVAWDKSSKLLENPVFNKVASAFLYSQYENTQDFFKQKGITQVVLTRGLHTTDPDIVAASKKKYTVKQPGYKPSGAVDRGEQEGQVASGEWDKGEWYTGPMSSWTLESDQAARFALANDAPSYKQPGIPVMIASKIPVERIIGGYWSGYGAFAVDEVVVLGTEHPTDKANWATYVNTGRAKFYGEEKLENMVTKDLAQGTKNVLKSLQQKKPKKPINIDEGHNADWIKTLIKPTMKSLLSYGLEPTWMDSMFKS